jgi:plastocyanin
MRRYMLILAVAGLLLCSALLAGCTTTTTTGTTATTSATTGVQTTSGGAAGQATAIALTAQNVKFDKTTISVPAGAQVTLTLNNMDSGVPHNFALYTDASAATTIFKGQIVNGPGTVTYTFTAPSTPGTYFFRCDVHPTTMTGSFIVT